MEQSLAQAGQGPKAQWTILFYLNGSLNELEESAECDLYELLAVDGSDKVDIIVQLAFPGPSRGSVGSIAAPCTQIGTVSRTIPHWTGTRRFVVRNHVVNESEIPNSTDMGAPDSLTEFVTWARQTHRAYHYMLVLSNHGEGRPLFDALHVPETARSKSPVTTTNELPKDIEITDTVPFQQATELHRFNDGSFVSLYKKAGTHILLNTEIRSALLKALKNEAFDIVGFDACYKDLLETAYTLRGLANIMVASEEAEPIKGWDHSDWLPKLISEPTMQPRKLGQMLVGSYRSLYQVKADPFTQASLDLTNLLHILDELDRFSEIVMASQSFREAVLNARKDLNVFEFQAIDLGAFLDVLLKNLKDEGSASAKLFKTAQSLQSALRRFVMQPPFMNGPSIRIHGSTGLAIYFPKSQYDLDHDPDRDYYDRCSSKAIDFVKDHQWGLLLRNLFAGNK
jgi:hypothetical protein